MYNGINSRINIVKSGKYNISAWAGSPIATGGSNRNYRIAIIKNGGSIYQKILYANKKSRADHRIRCK